MRLVINKRGKLVEDILTTYSGILLGIWAKVPIITHISWDYGKSDWIITDG